MYIISYKEKTSLFFTKTLSVSVLLYAMKCNKCCVDCKTQYHCTSATISNLLSQEVCRTHFLIPTSQAHAHQLVTTYPTQNLYFVYVSFMCNNVLTIKM